MEKCVFYSLLQRGFWCCTKNLLVIAQLLQVPMVCMEDMQTLAKYSMQTEKESVHLQLLPLKSVIYSD